MPSAAEFQALSDELRQLGAVIVQAANLGDQGAFCKEMASFGMPFPCKQGAMFRPASNTKSEPQRGPHDFLFDPVLNLKTPP